MSEFKVIETQEAFDAAIADRLKRDREKYSRQFEAEMREKGWKTTEEVEALTAELTKQIETLQSAAASTEQIIAAKDAEIAKGEAYRADLAKTRIAIAAGLSIDQATRLRGSTEEEWQADAQQMVKEIQAFSAGKNVPAPMPQTGDASVGKTTRSQFADWAVEALG